MQADHTAAIWRLVIAARTGRRQDLTHVFARTADLTALLDVLDAATERVQALETAAQRLIDELQAPDDEYRLNEADKAMDAVIAALALSSERAAGSGEGGE